MYIDYNKALNVALKESDIRAAKEKRRGKVKNIIIIGLIILIIAI